MTPIANDHGSGHEWHLSPVQTIMMSISDLDPTWLRIRTIRFSIAQSRRSWWSLSEKASQTQSSPLLQKAMVYGATRLLQVPYRTTVMLLESDKSRLVTISSPWGTWITILDMIHVYFRGGTPSIIANSFMMVHGWWCVGDHHKFWMTWNMDCHMRRLGSFIVTLIIIRDDDDFLRKTRIGIVDNFVSLREWHMSLYWATMVLHGWVR